MQTNSCMMTYLMPMSSSPCEMASCWGRSRALTTSSSSAPSAADKAMTRRANASRCSSVSCLDCPKSIRPASSQGHLQLHNLE